MTHAVVWIDHKEARIFHVHPEAAEESTIFSPQHHIHRHPPGSRLCECFREVSGSCRSVAAS